MSTNNPHEPLVTSSRTGKSVPLTTDASPRPKLTAHNRYTTITHVNSNNAHRRGETRRFDPALNHVVLVTVRTHTIYRDLYGEPLPHSRPPRIIRAWNASRYTPHVGAKQRAKLAVIK